MSGRWQWQVDGRLPHTLTLCPSSPPPPFLFFLFFFFSSLFSLSSSSLQSISIVLLSLFLPLPSLPSLPSLLSLTISLIFSPLLHSFRSHQVSLTRCDALIISINCLSFPLSETLSVIIRNHLLNPGSSIQKALLITAWSHSSRIPWVYDHYCTTTATIIASINHRSSTASFNLQ